jgi:hypothetical protein
MGVANPNHSSLERLAWALNRLFKRRVGHLVLLILAFPCYSCFTRICKVCTTILFPLRKIHPRSAPALPLAVKNPRSKKALHQSLMFHQSLTTFSLHHTDTRIVLVWNHESEVKAIQLAADACQRRSAVFVEILNRGSCQKDGTRTQELL